MKTTLSRAVTGFSRDPEGLRKLVGGAIGSAAIAIMLTNVITLAHLGMSDPREIAAQNEVLLLLVFGGTAFATARWKSRISEWTQVIILFATALLTANEAKPGDLTSALILIFAFILPFEYNFGKKVIAIYVSAAFVLFSVILASGYSVSSPAYLTQFAAAVLGLLFFAALYGGVALRHRIRLEDEAERLEEKVKERTTELEGLLSERAAMLSEIHHRVKNNLQLVASLLQLGADRADGTNYRRSLDAGVRRIHAMALVHDSLYDTERLDRIDLADYSRQLLDTIAQESSFRFDFSVEGSVLGPIDLAVPFGLILHELSTNAQMHAFPGGEGRAEIHLAARGGTIELRVSDEGVGMTETPGGRPAGAIGLELVRALASQLHGVLKRMPGPGTIWLLSFPADQPTTRFQVKN